MLNFDLVVAARPNFMKAAPLYHALRNEPWCRMRIIHTGQHYDANMSDSFLRDFDLPKPDVHLGVGSGLHGEQLGGVMIAYERAVQAERPDWIVVVGDVNSTAACAIVGAKLWIPVVHLEAGLRSRDRRMPEEINRVITDAVADVLWTPSEDAVENLLAEGVSPDKIDRVGNIMIDAYEMMRSRIEAATARKRFGLESGRYGVVTLHRPSNVDAAGSLAELVEGLCEISRGLPLVFPVHPRTRKRLDEFGLLSRLETRGVKLAEPLSYVEFMNLVCGAAIVITDSGGVQEETTYLGIPCITLRDNTERPITVTHGTNRLSTAGKFVGLASEMLNGARMHGRRPELWDGHTADRCVEALRRRCGVN